MTMYVGSTNPTKIDAVREVLTEDDSFKGMGVVGIATMSDVSEQPTTLDETIRGAMNRAVTIHDTNCMYSIGIEAGLIILPGQRVRMMNHTVCVIYNGHDYFIGFSPAFEIPSAMVRSVQNGLDIDKAAHRIGLTEDEKIGYSKGLIGILSGGKISRKEYMKPGIVMALTALKNWELYQPCLE